MKTRTTYEGIEGKIKIIARLIKEGSESIKIRDFTLNLIGDNNLKSFEQIKKVYSYVFYNIRYVSDIKNVETFYTAEKCLEVKAGDCDDKVILGGAMLRTIGYDLYITIADTGKGYFNHIFLMVELDKKLIPFDTSTSLYSFNYLPVFRKIRLYYIV